MNGAAALCSEFADVSVWARKESPLYSRLGAHIVKRPDLAGLLLANPHPERRLPVLLFATVHDLVLAHPDSELAQW